MVVGDDDQSIYRFRGRRFAAFAEFQARFSRPPAHGPTRPRRRPAPPPHRPELPVHAATSSTPPTASSSATSPASSPTSGCGPSGTRASPSSCTSAPAREDEAVAIVDAIKALAGPGTRPHGWTDVAVLYRKHKHRDAIVARLRDEDIPYTVVGGLSPVRGARDPGPGAGPARHRGPPRRRRPRPHDDRRPVAPRRPRDPAASRATPASTAAASSTPPRAWSRAARARGRPRPRPRGGAARRPSPPGCGPSCGAAGRHRGAQPAHLARGPVHHPRSATSSGPATVLDLLAAGTLEAKRSVVNIASFMRFASDWQAENPAKTLADFVDYLDAYKAAGGELPDQRGAVRGRRRRPPHDPLPGEGPGVPDRHRPATCSTGSGRSASRAAAGSRASCCASRCPTGDIHTDEERRLLYVAMTRAQERLILATHGDGGEKAASRFVGGAARRGGGGAGRRRPHRRRRRDPAGGVDDRGSGRGRLAAARATEVAEERPRGRPGRRSPGHAAAHRARAPPRDAPAGRGARRPARGHRRPPIPRPRAPARPSAPASRTWAAAPRWPPTRRGPPASTRSPSGPSPSTPAPAPTSSPSRRCRAASPTRRSRTYEACPLQYAFKLRLPDPGAGSAGRRPSPSARPRTRPSRPSRSERRERIARGEPAAHPRGPGAALRGELEARRRSATRPPRRPSGGASAGCWTTSGTASSATSARPSRGAGLRRSSSTPATAPRR